MKSLIIGDIHFGIKSNSLTWLESQLKLVNILIKDTIVNEKIERVIFLGDVSDIRYSINQQIGIEVKKLFRNLLNQFPNVNFIIIAGNHDYFSPLEEHDQYNFYELVFGEEFYTLHKNLKVIDKDPWLDHDGSLYIPWYWTENPDHFDEILYNYDFNQEVKSIYCHADLAYWPGPRTGLLKGCPVYSGHIHNYAENSLCNLYNLGSVLSLTFADFNQSKYIYIIEDHKIIRKIENNITPKFKRLYDEEIFDTDEDYFNNAYVQLCISSQNINKAKYIEQIKNIKLNYINSNIRIHIIDSDVNIDTLNVKSFDTNISKYIDENIPEHLDDKYNKIKNKLLDK